jgi:hypothetical protein
VKLTPEMLAVAARTASVELLGLDAAAQRQFVTAQIARYAEAFQRREARAQQGLPYKIAAELDAPAVLYLEALRDAVYPGIGKMKWRSLGWSAALTGRRPAERVLANAGKFLANGFF